MTNIELKTKLFNQIAAIGSEQAIFPAADTAIDRTIQELEKVSPITQPLSASHQETLCGDWELVYASNGTVVTRPVAEVTAILGSVIKLQKIWQSLYFAGETLTASNQALIDLLVLGEYQVGAKGSWEIESDLKSARVSFTTFTTQAVKVLHQSLTLPAIEVPVIEIMQSTALWITSYLDADTRIGRGATGNLFVFRRF